MPSVNSPNCSKSYYGRFVRLNKIFFMSQTSCEQQRTVVHILFKLFYPVSHIRSLILIKFISRRPSWLRACWAVFEFSEHPRPFQASFWSISSSNKNLLYFRYPYSVSFQSFHIDRKLIEYGFGSYWFATCAKFVFLNIFGSICRSAEFDCFIFNNRVSSRMIRMCGCSVRLQYSRICSTRGSACSDTASKLLWSS